MSASLQSFLPVLCRQFGLTPHALYGRQRALERAGLLGAREGKWGPGSGIRLTPSSAAMMLIALLATDSADPAIEAEAVAKLKNTTSKCPLTGSATFADALAAVFASDDLRAKAQYISINRAAPVATIVYMGDSGPEASTFTPKGKMSVLRPPVEIDAKISPEAFRQIADAIAEALE